jgi:hypothetical protein
VQQTIQRVEGLGLVAKPPKTAGSCQPVLLGSDVVTLLKKHKAEQNVVRLVVGSEWQDNGLVFPSRTGAPLDVCVVRRVFARICGKAGVPVPC